MNHSDVFETLYSGNEGYVLYCGHCNRYRLAFISTALMLSAEEYGGLRSHVEMLYHQHIPESMDLNCKSIIIPSVSDQVQIVLTRTELNRLQQMLDRADTEKKVNALMALFNG